ncbi:MAG: DUF3109 family protein [Chloroflexi bacterium]|jgi:hypothetical protein|nr:DUF3109 family protein [Chloroflexota bacterium]MBT3669298.1 DUF3109 family protein [Chloroflexota bacterium]MBT4003262.1 DUF3109 family protein [Chloroflexota bacterium]MBT4306005.1 DUF3109 family protein [Chloroflexota bacterium]MBT4532649.1 DUF3109 family protein [Chloroflexota bacterium]
MSDKRLDPRLFETKKAERCNFPECKAACCVYGTWVDKVHVEDILENAEIILPYMPVDNRQAELWFNHKEENDPHALSGKVIPTTVVPDPDHYGGSACIFLRGDYKCALQVAGEENNLHPWRFKPFYCILHPLEMDDQNRITLDKIHLLVAEEASCLRMAEKDIPLQDTFAEELEYFLKKKEK